MNWVKYVWITKFDKPKIMFEPCLQISEEMQTLTLIFCPLQAGGSEVLGQKNDRN